MKCYHTTRFRPELKHFHLLPVKPLETFVPCSSHFKVACILIPIKACKPVYVWGRARFPLAVKCAQKCLLTIAVWIFPTLTVVMWKWKEGSNSLVRTEQEIRETGSVALRIQDIPITRLLTPNAHLVKRNGKNLSVVVNELCFPGCNCIFYFSTSVTWYSAGFQDSRVIRSLGERQSLN